MKLDPRAFLDDPKSAILGRRKKELDVVKIDAGIKLALDELDGDEKRQEAFLRLLMCVRSRGRLLKPTQGRAGWVAAAFLINRLKNLAARQSSWIRDCETWRPESGNLRPAFRSLAHHLLALYPVPSFMDSVWDLAAGPEGFRQQSWYIRLGRGTSFRSLNLPCDISRRMEHFVRQAPDHYTLSQALRYGETRGLGGGEELAREVVIGLLGRTMEHPAFWRSVLGFFVTHPEVKLEHVNPIIDYVHAQKFAGENILTVSGIGCRQAPRPDFSMKGRSLKALLRLVSAWHADLAIDKNSPCLSWRKSGIQGYQFLEQRGGDAPDRDWTILELLNSNALQAEGREMRHCVFSYAQRCWHRETTIWSLRLRVADREKRIVTIEVDPRKRSIIQARAKCNRRPGVHSFDIIRQWAVFAGLQFDLRA